MSGDKKEYFWTEEFNELDEAFSPSEQEEILKQQEAKQELKEVEPVLEQLEPATEEKVELKEEIEEKIEEVALGTIIFDKYKIIKKIGEGGMNSQIYLAENINENSNKKYAIKFIKRTKKVSDDEWKKLLDECITSARVSNKENLVQTYQIEKNDEKNTIIIVMEYIDGESLRYLISKKGSLAINEALYIFKKIVIAIRDLHSFDQKIIHRDLKPENILISKDRLTVKVIDFGISSVVLKNEKQKSILTNENAIYGTEGYITPDVFAWSKNNPQRNIKVISEQFDFFALGVILYEMLMGVKPFAFEKDKTEINKILKLPLMYDMPVISEIRSDINEQIENIIFKCLASKVDDLQYRYQSANEILTDLENYELNPNKATALLKPKKDRVLQKEQTFNWIHDRFKESLFYKWWFILIIFILIVASIGYFVFNKFLL